MMRVAAFFMALTMLHLHACMHAIAADGPLKLRLTVQGGLDSPVGRQAGDFRRVAAELSKDAVAVEVFDDKQISIGNLVPEVVASGAIEMGIAQLSLYAGKIPSAAIFRQPFLFDKAELVRAASRPDAEFRQIIDRAILEKTGTRVLWWHPYGATVMFTRGDAVTNPTAIAGKTIHAIDQGTAKFVSLCGGTPLVFSESAMLNILRSKKVDGVMGGIFYVRTREIWRETHVISKIRHSQEMFVATINENIWQSLAEETRNLLLDAARRVEDSYWEEFTRSETENYQFASEKGMIVSEISSDDLVNWRICSSQMLESFVEDAGETATELMLAYGKIKSQLSLN